MAADSTKWLPFLDAGLDRLAALEQGVPPNAATIVIPAPRPWRP
jgi:hypothetical protein